jgi:hypothetical protein
MVYEVAISTYLLIKNFLLFVLLPLSVFENFCLFMNEGTCYIAVHVCIPPALRTTGSLPSIHVGIGFNFYYGK